MWTYLLYWVHNVKIGWEIGGGIFEKIEFFTILISAGLLGCKKTRKFHSHWKNGLEEFVMKWAFHICWISFLISTAFVAPFIQHKEDEIKNTENKHQAPVIFNTSSNILTDSAFILGNGNNVNNSKTSYYGDTNKPSFRLYAFDPQDIPSSTRDWAECEVKDWTSIFIPKNESISFCVINTGEKTVANLSMDMIAECQEEECNLSPTGLWRRLPSVLAPNYPIAGKATFFPHWGIESIHSFPPGLFQPADRITISTNYPHSSCPMIISVYADNTPVFKYHFKILFNSHP